MTYIFCPCGKGQIIGTLRGIVEPPKPKINCLDCADNWFLKSYLKRDSWQGTYWYEWTLKAKL